MGTLLDHAAGAHTGLHTLGCVLLLNLVRPYTGTRVYTAVLPWYTAVLNLVACRIHVYIAVSCSKCFKTRLLSLQTMLQTDSYVTRLWSRVTWAVLSLGYIRIILVNIHVF